MTGKVIITEQGERFLLDELGQYYANFGSMNKNDFEVLLFQVLMKSGYNSKRNFEISRILRIPEAKIKRLRYEADLKYAPTSDSKYREEKLHQLNKLLTKVSLKKDGKLIEFVVEDIALRQFLDNILKENNRFSDTSFNSEVVKVDIKDLEILFRSSVENDKLCDQLLKEAEKLLKQRINLAELLPSLIKLIADSTSLAADVSLPGLLRLLPTVSKTLVSMFKRN